MKSVSDFSIPKYKEVNKINNQLYYEGPINEATFRYLSSLAEFLNSEVGKFLLFRQQTGYIKTLTKSNLQSMDVYIPSLKRQEKLIVFNALIKQNL